MSYLDSQAYKNTYSKNKNTYKDSLSKTAQFNTTWTSLGMSAGSALAPGVGTIAGAVLGGIADLFSFGARSSMNRSEALSKLKDSRDTAASTYRDYARGYNNLLAKSQNLINRTSAGFESSFGRDSYNMFSGMFSSILQNQSMDELIRAARTVSENVEGVDGSESMILDGMDEATRNRLLSQAITINDINKAYYDYLTEYFANGNTLYSSQADLASRQEELLYAQNDEGTESLKAQYGHQLDQAYQERRSAVGQEALSMGASEAQSGASGIRQTGSGRNLKLLKNYEQMLSLAAYSTTVDYLVTSYQEQLKNTQNGFLYQAYATRNSNNQTKLQQLMDYVSKGNEAQSSNSSNLMDLQQTIDDAAAAYADWSAINDTLNEREEANKLAQELAAKTMEGMDEHDIVSYLDPYDIYDNHGSKYENNITVTEDPVTGEKIFGTK